MNHGTDSRTYFHSFYSSKFFRTRKNQHYTSDLYELAISYAIAWWTKKALTLKIIFTIGFKAENTPVL